MTDRIIDANLNRVREGLRVIEDINRYIFNNATLSQKIKSLRHRCKVESLLKYISSRDVSGDVLKNIDDDSSKTNIETILISNYKRVEESARTLEEIFKLSDKKLSEQFKGVRYSAYELEREQFTDKS